MKATVTMPRILIFILPVSLILCLSGCERGSESPPKAEPSRPLSDPTSQGGGSEYPDNAVAAVDDYLILREDAEKRAMMNMRRDGIEESDPDFQTKLRVARKGAVDMLIESYILQQAATDTIEVSSQEVEDELQSIKMRHPNRESYEEGLRRAGFSEDEFRRVMAKEIRIRKAMGTAAGKGVPTPTPEEAREFYDQNPFLFEWPRRVRFDEIVWPLSPEVSEASKEQALREMNHLADRIAASRDLFNTILRDATAASWGPVGVENPYTNLESLTQEVQDALRVLNIDEPSRPVRTPVGLSILCIRSTRQTYDSAYQEILQSLFEARAIDNLEAWKEREKAKRTIRILDLDYYEGRAEAGSGAAG